jgi:hypothetical protein
MYYLHVDYKLDLNINITNLASHNLVMKIVQNSFIHYLFVSWIDIMH